jgi:GrpB-like predicted nucleotidyltransferase (UPF0157 family)
VLRRDPIVIADYDPLWPLLFERERVALEQALGSTFVRPIEHIGSTAVAGLAAKPIIDMCAVVADIDDVADRASELSRIGWVAAPEPGDLEERRLSYCTPAVEWRTHHLHVVEETSQGWRGWLAFRDYLRMHPGDAAAYADLKRSSPVKPQIRMTGPPLGSGSPASYRTTLDQRLGSERVKPARLPPRRLFRRSDGPARGLAGILVANPHHKSRSHDMMGL